MLSWGSEQAYEQLPPSDRYIEVLNPSPTTLAMLILSWTTTAPKNHGALTVPWDLWRENTNGIPNVVVDC
jgi:hypothetical protein